MITRQVIELIKEEDAIQDTRLIIKYISLRDREPIRNIVSPSTPILKSKLLSKTIENQNLGVDKNIGLLSPKQTPKLVILVGSKSSVNNQLTI